MCIYAGYALIFDFENLKIKKQPLRTEAGREPLASPSS